MTPYRQRVIRADGRTINVVQRRGHLSYCDGACCCGRTDRGYAAVPIEVYKEEWLKRKLRNVVHMTKGGCLGPCPLANVASLEFDGRSVFDEEIGNVLNALEGKYVPAGPAGAPTRGMASILPTGRNFYAVDPRALPSPAAWQVGRQLARETLARYLKEENAYPEMAGLSIWATSQMRTLGDDVSEALSFLGVKPVWNAQSRRIDGVEAIPLDELDRPRVDVTLRVSGFFRDAFPHLISLLDDAVRLVVSLDEPPEWNFPRKHYLAEMAKPSDLSIEDAEQQALDRIFGAKPGSYGVGLSQLMETGHWQTTDDLAKVFL